MAASSSEASSLEDELKDTRRKIRTEQKVIKQLEGKKTSLLESLEDLDRQIVHAAKTHQVSQVRMDSLLREKQEMKNQLRVLGDKIEKQRREQGRRLTGYYRLGRTGMLPLIFSDATAPEKFRNLDSLKRILVSDWECLQAFHDLLQEKERVKTSLQEQLEAEEALQETLERRKRALGEKKQERNALLFRIEQDRDLHKRLLEELKESAQALEEEIKEERTAPVDMTGGALSTRKGRLPWPVEGTLYRRFGKRQDPRFRTVIQSKGVDIKAEPGSPVRAVWGGGVVYADWFRGYGKLLIIHHGGKDYSVLAHLSRLTRRRGERVEAGEIVGHAGDTGSVDGCLVHLEIWHEGKPRDPVQWLQSHKGRHR